MATAPVRRIKITRSFIFFLIIFIILFSLIIFRKQSKKTTPVAIQTTKTSIPTPYKPVPPEEEQPDVNQTEPEVEDIYHKKLEDIAGNALIDTQCQNINSSFIPDEGLLIKLFDYVKSYRFSDEIKIQDEDGNITIENEGKKSSKNIIFETFCKNKNGYFILFETEGKDSAFFNLIPSFDVKAAGGVSNPSNFGFINTEGNIILIEDMGQVLKRIDVDWGKTGPYYGCRRILGSTENSVIISCGGGDGPGFVTSIFTVDLIKKSVEEEVLCGNINSEFYATQEIKCFDKSGNLYRTESIGNIF